jgi:hypothetical protein
LPLCKVAHHRKLESLALQRLHHEHNPNREEGEANDHGKQPHEQVAKDGNEKQDEGRDPEQRSNYQGSQTHSEALKGMKAHEAVFVVGLDEKEHNRRQKKVSQGASQRLGQRAYDASGALDRTHGAAARGAVSGGIGHR